MKKAEMIATIKSQMSKVEWKVLGAYIESLKVKDLEEILQNAKKEPISISKKTAKDDFSEFEPKNDKDGQYIWASYKVCRAAYAYSKLGVKVWRGKPQWKDGERQSFDWDEFNKLKANFEKHFGKYVPKAKR